MDAAIPADAQNAPTGIWKSRTEREIPTAPTPIIVVVNERKNNGDSNSVAKPSTESDQAQVYQSGHLGPRPLPGARGYSAGRATGVAAHAGVAPGDRDSRHRVLDRTGVAAAPPGSAAVCTGLGGAGRSSVDKCRGPVIGKIRFGRGRLAARVTVAFLHLLQPLARLRGRLKHGLTLWRKCGPEGMSWPLPRALPTCVTP